MNVPLESAALARVRNKALYIGIAGLAACLIGVFVAPREFLHAWLWAYWYWLGIAIGCGMALMLYHLVGGGWGFVLQRIFEAGLRTLPIMFLLVLPLLAGMAHVYSYADPHAVAADGALRHKIAYLNIPFVLVRLAIYFFIWWIFARFLTRWSDRQDETGNLVYLRLREKLSGPGLILYVLAISFMAIDWFMALEPDWYSSMYPGFYIVGEGLTALAFGIIVLHYISRFSPMSEIVASEDFHDQGNLLLTFVILWAYVQLAQLIVTWSGNTPKEITWYLHRTRGDWAWIALTLALFHFFFPFFALLSRRSKLQSQRLATLAVLVLVVHAIDNYWNVEPAFHRQAYVHWLDFAAPAGIGGVFVALFLWHLGRRPLAPVHDPRLEEALEKA